MNLYQLVLGEDYAAYMVVAFVCGIVSAVVSGLRLGDRSTKSDTELQVQVAKCVALCVFLFVVWREADGIFDTVIRVSVPVGLYKMVQLVGSSLLLWRFKNPAEVQSHMVNGNG